jgi:hypothetical protein
MLGGGNDKRLVWYDAYNASKHDRHSSFRSATLNNLIDAVCGLLVILSAQFYNNEFGPGVDLLAISGPPDEFEYDIGNYFSITFPNDWQVGERYSFTLEEWRNMAKQPDPFGLLFP